MLMKNLTLKMCMYPKAGGLVKDVMYPGETKVVQYASVIT